MSKSLWGDLSSIDENHNPLDILKEQSGYLLDATNNIIYADIANRKPDIFSGDPESEFATIFSLRSKMMETYRFELFTLFYNITFFPLFVEIDENIAETLEVGFEPNGFIKVENEEDFHKLLQHVLANNFTKKVITSLYAMSK